MKYKEFMIEQTGVKPAVLIVKSSESRPGVFRLIDRNTRDIIGEIQSMADVDRLINPRRLPGAAVIILISPALRRQYPDITDSFKRWAGAMSKTQGRPVEIRMMDREIQEQGANLNTARSIARDIKAYKKKVWQR